MVDSEAGRKMYKDYLDGTADVNTISCPPTQEEETSQGSKEEGSP